MMRGSVDSRLEATIPLGILGPNQRLPITAIIDTGYDGAPTLPMAVVIALSLPLLTAGDVILANGTRKTLSYFRADVQWNGRTTTIRVLCVETDPLVGTALLKGHHLGVEFVDGGAVEIVALP